MQMQYVRELGLHEKQFQLPVPLQPGNMTEITNKELCFLKTVHQVKGQLTEA